MPRKKFQTLTEQMFYILLCLQTEHYGFELYDCIAEMTDKRVTVSSGTLYTLLDQFIEAGMIRVINTQERKHSYALTDAGRIKLKKEYDRLKAQIADYHKTFGCPAAELMLKKSIKKDDGPQK